MLSLRPEGLRHKSNGEGAGGGNAMTRRETYPLKALLRLREEIHKQREHGLAAALQALERAESRLEQASQQLRRQQERLAKRRQRLFQGDATTASERGVAQRFVDRLKAEAGQLAAAEEQATAALQQHRRQVEAARRELREAEAELKVVERNREAWSEQRRREALARAEAELEDLVASRPRERD